LAGECRLTGSGGTAKVSLRTLPITGQQAVRRAAEITGLVPGRRYSYTVTVGGKKLEGSFQTAPAAGSREPLTFMVMSDTQSYPKRHRPVVEAALREPAPAFLLVCGDLTSDGPAWWRWEKEFFTPTAELLQRTTLWPVRGNHEKDGVAFRELFRRPGAGPNCSFDYANVHVVCLDQYKVDKNADLEGDDLAQLAAWLDRDLAASKAEWKIVCYHQPTFNVAGHESDWGREQVLPVFQKHGVDLVLAGHSHVHERFVPIGEPGTKPIIYMVLNSTGGVVRSTSPSPMLAASRKGSAYYVFTVEGSRLTMVAKDTDGKAFDQFTLEKTDGKYQKSVMDAVVPTSDALDLVGVFTNVAADFPARPAAGKAMTITLAGGQFPKKSRVTIGPDAAGPWRAEAVSFTEDGEVKSLTVTPPEGVLLAEAQSFTPPLTVAVTLDHKGQKYGHSAVPIRMTAETLRRLVPPPEPVRVAAAKTVISVDGDLADWKDVPYLRLPSTGAASTSVKLAWRDEGLFGSVRVVQGGPLTVDADAPWSSDGLELCLEADARRRLNADSTGTPMRHFLLPQAGKSGGAMTIRRSYGKLEVREAMQTAWRKTSDGYAMEFCVPTKSLTSSGLKAGRRMGLHFALRHGDQIVTEFTDTKPFRSVASTPAYWGQIELSAN
jgi:predicted phosphodiesterase